VAKKNPRNEERRALVEKMRAEQARKERQRSMLILGACIVVVLGLLSAAVIPYIKKQHHDSVIANSGLAKLGATKAAAACLPLKTKAPTGLQVSGVNGNHVNVGTPITYTDAPPAFGQHWPNYLTSTEQRNFWTPQDRPPLEQMVHSMEHGHTYLWYDDTIKPGSAEYQTLQDIAQKFSSNLYFNVLPWKSTDGGSFPSGTHVVLTHWTDTNSKQLGVWEYCGQASGQVVADFTKAYPSSDAPEPGAP
jgi:hypothetical protein